MIPIIKPVMDEREAEAARRVILCGWITQGPEVAAFEREFAAFVGAPHACAVSNCTTALHLALLAVGVRPGDEVDHRQPLVHRHRERHPLLRRDAGVRRHRAGHVQHRSRAASRRRSRERTRAILCVHQMGMPCDLAAILADRARARRSPVIEDAACASAARSTGRGAGSGSAGRTATSPASRSIRAR